MTNSAAPRPFAALTTAQLDAAIAAQLAWVSDRSGVGPVDPSTFATIQALASERAAR